MRVIKNRTSVLKQKSTKGFTLIELILVIIILGIMAVGISGFITLSTQTYLNATNRDELIGNARFAIERLNRELRNAAPNSIRITNSTSPQGQCIQFTPIEASTVYIDIPVFPKEASQTLSVIPFINSAGGEYQCDDAAPDVNNRCDALVTIYPLNSDDIYTGHSDSTSKTFIITKIDIPDITLQSAINVEEESPTQRLYIIKNQVSYCAMSGFLYRYQEPIVSGNQVSPPATTNNMIKMAGYLNNLFPFNYQPATLKRNAVVQIKLDLTKNGENYVLDHEVHMNNVP